MKKFLYFYKYLIPYWKSVAVAIMSTLISIVFSLFSISMIIPFFSILFDTREMVLNPVPFSFDISSITHNFFYLMSKIIIDHGKLNGLIFVCVVIVVMFLLKNIFIYLNEYLLAPVRNGVVKDLRQKLYRKILRLPLSFFSDERKGDIMSRMTNDLNEIDISVMRSLDLIFLSPLQIIFYLIALIYISPELTIFVLLLLPLSGIVIGTIGSKLKKASATGQRRIANILSIIEETLGGLKIIKAFSAEKLFNGKFDDENRKYNNTMVYFWRRRMLASPMSEILGISTIACVMYYGGYLIIEGNDSGLTADSFIGYIALFSQILNPAKSFTSSYYSLLKGIASIERIEIILKAPETINDNEKAISLNMASSQSTLG